MPEDELEGLRTDFRNGRLDIRIEQASFSVHEYNEVGAKGSLGMRPRLEG